MIDGRQRVTAAMRYAIDVAVPDMAHVALVRSPVAAGRIRRIDAGAARQLPGVLLVATAEDVVQAGLGEARFGTMQPDQPILAVDRVRCVGEPVAAVVARDPVQAWRAARLVAVALDPEPAVFDPDEALAEEAPLVHEESESNLLARWGYEHGDLAAAQASAAHRFKGIYWSPAAQQASLEPHVCVARWTGAGVELWSTTQNPSRVAAEIARVFALDEGSVRLHVPPLGGGYGGKNHMKQEPLAVFLARLAGRPVRLANRREEEFVTVTKHPARVEIETGTDADGHFLYRDASIRWSAGAYTLSSKAVVRAGALAVCGPYRVSAARVESLMAYTNLPPAGSFRGLGVNQAAWASEQQVDEIAAALSMDPLELRRKNLVGPSDRLPMGEAAGEARWRECLDEAVAGLGPERSSDGHVARGRGVAVVMKHTITPSRSEAAVALLADGTVEVRSSAVDMGQGAPTVMARLAADTLDVPIGRVRVISPDTAVTPFDATTSSSRATFMVGGAVERAAADLLECLRDAANRVLGTSAARVSIADQRVVAASGEEHPLAAIVRGGGEEIVGHGLFVNEPAADPVTGKPVSSSHWHQGAVAVDVVVDRGTGVVRVERAHAVAWAGRVVTVEGARLQNEGNLIFGLGPTLFESLPFDDGHPLAQTLLDYRIPSIGDVPDQLTSRALAAAAGRGHERHGLGESVTPAVAPAVGNALAAATGVRLRSLPLSPEAVLRAMKGVEPSAAPRRQPRPAASSAGLADPIPVAMELKVNGSTARLEADPLTPLAFLLRERLGLRSVREPCGVGACGACTVLIDGSPARACLQPAGTLAGRQIQTVEGLPPDHDVVEAFVGATAFQCGFCTPGFVMSTTALLADQPRPDEAAVRGALIGNLCRCGSYNHILAAVRAAARHDPGQA